MLGHEGLQDLAQSHRRVAPAPSRSSCRQDEQDGLMASEMPQTIEAGEGDIFCRGCGTTRSRSFFRKGEPFCRYCQKRGVTWPLGAVSIPVSWTPPKDPKRQGIHQRQPHNGARHPEDIKRAILDAVRALEPNGVGASANQLVAAARVNRQRGLEAVRSLKSNGILDASGRIVRD